MGLIMRRDDAMTKKQPAQLVAARLGPTENFGKKPSRPFADIPLQGDFFKTKISGWSRIASLPLRSIAGNMTGVESVRRALSALDVMLPLRRAARGVSRTGLRASLPLNEAELSTSNRSTCVRPERDRFQPVATALPFGTFGQEAPRPC